METVILSLGGSLIVPDQVDAAFLAKFKILIEKQVKQGKRFVIVCGGGKTNSRYLKTLEGITEVAHEDGDWLGIMATRLNAEFVRILFGEMAHPKVLIDPTEKSEAKEPVIIAAGWKPGHSTDYDAVLWAKQFGANQVLNLSNIDYVYDKDPREHKDARPIPAFSWKEFLEQFGGAWTPRMHKPFDPIASKEAARLKLKVVIANGADLGNVEKILDGGKFKGTIIN